MRWLAIVGALSSRLPSDSAASSHTDGKDGPTSPKRAGTLDNCQSYRHCLAIGVFLDGSSLWPGLCFRSPLQPALRRQEPATGTAGIPAMTVIRLTCMR